MINFKFIVNKDYLALNMIEFNFFDKEYLDYLWEKYNDEYKDVLHNFSNYLNSNKEKKLLTELKKNSKFKEELLKTKQNAIRIEKNLNTYKDKIDKTIKELCKIDLKLPLQKVYIVKLGGLNFGNNRILWGNINGYSDPYYDLVYLYHEALHSFFEQYKKSKNIQDKKFDHILIQYLTDIILAYKLGGKRYGTHDHLEKLEIKLFPILKKYFKNLGKWAYPKDTIIKDRTSFKNLDFKNIIDLYNWLLKNKELIDNISVKRKIEIK